jgi:hypothetical protein
MPHHSITANAAELCQRLIADPHADSVQRSLAGQLLAFVESFCSDRQRDPFYEDCIRHLTLDITGQAL